jgi:hypothetical protein
MLTGCKEQYLIKKRPDGSWQPTHKVGSFPDNSNKGWASNKSEWAAWPAYGSVPAAQGSCDEKMLFNRMCHWDDHNFLMGASSLGHDDTHQSGGIVRTPPSPPFPLPPRSQARPWVLTEGLYRSACNGSSQ